VLALLDDDWSLGRPAQIAERAPGTTMLAAMRSAPGQARVLLRRLASLHAQLHELSTDGWPAPQARGVTASRRLALVRARAAKDPGIADALHRVERALDGLQAEPEVVCHGDFHPLNVIVDRSGAAAVVDWTDAALDDRHSDVARTVVLLRSAAVAGGSSLERVLLALIGPVLAFGYLRAYRGLLPVDRDRLLRWEALHLLNGWAQIAAIEDGGFDSSSAGRRFPRWVLRSVQVRLRGALRRAGAQ
jgi:aminoglycoside phosphotransferase (APT) family kinase protein